MNDCHAIFCHVFLCLYHCITAYYSAVQPYKAASVWLCSIKSVVSCQSWPRTDNLYMLVHRTELNKSTQLQATFIGHVRQRHDYTSYWVAAAKLGRLVLGWCQIPLHGHGPDQTGTDPTRQSPRTSRRPRFPAKSGRARLQWNLDISFQHMFPAAVHTRVQISSVHMPWTSVNRNPIQKVAHTRLPA